MRIPPFSLGLSILLLVAAPPFAAADAPSPSVELGRHVAVTSGCNDCHTPGYPESGGKLDPAVALIGSPVGFRGPWGTTYPSNLRRTIAGLDEDHWVTFAKSFETRPPMPWFNVQEMTKPELRSLYLYVKSLGALGDAAPDYVPPDRQPQTPFVVFAPPQMPIQ